MGLQINFTIRKKDNGYQLIGSYKVGRNWKQKSKQGFKTKVDAKAYQATMIKELEQLSGLTTDKTLLNITLNEFLEQIYLRDKKNTLSETTIINYKMTINIIRELKDKRIVDISYQDISTQVYLLTEKYSIGTTNICITILKLLMNYAVKYKILKSNPAEHIQHIKDKRTEKRISLDNDTYNKLLNALNPKEKIIHFYILVAMQTGMRKSEISGLTWQDINFKKSSININKQYVLNKFAPVKNKHGNRVIPIPKMLTTLFIYWQKKQKEQDCKKRIFYKSCSESYSNQTIHKLIGKKYSMHSLRHTYATRLLSHGVDIKTVSALLGDTVATVINNYVHYTDDMRKQASNMINNIF
jgi:site-specific recombinase, phage integrase family|nr:MAG TPA: Integrase [Caudoviricetes sp.]